MRVKILEAARLDLLAGHAFYERREVGVGDHFLNTLFAEIDSLALHAGQHLQKNGLFKMLSIKFPYAIYYRIEENCAVVRAVLDCRRDPARIRRRLKQERTKRSS